MIAILFLNVLLIYLLIGFIFALLFVFKGVNQVDPVAKDTSWRFRLLILPGSMAFWPVLLRKWLKSRRHDSTT